MKYPHKATIWRKGELDMRGNISYSPPEHIMVRWDEDVRLILTNDGREERGRATIWFEQDIFSSGDYVALGHHTESTPINSAYEIRDRRAISNFAGTRTEYRAII